MIRPVYEMLLIAMLFTLIGADFAPPDDRPIAPATTQSVRFTFVDAYIDPKGQSLAAYQFELFARGADVTLVGVEGGDAPAFTEPPYYDPKANLQNRIVIAAFNTGDKLPAARTRVARLMLRVSGTSSPTYSAKLDIAASSDAKPVNAEITLSEGVAQ
jgi:hypothetical protein